MSQNEASFPSGKSDSEVESKVDDKQTETNNNTSTPKPDNVTQMFRCCLCNLHAKYSYYGTRPLERNQESTTSNKSQTNQLNKEQIILMEKCYICDDPFTPTNKLASYFILGANCHLCNRMVCLGAECSFFYYKKRFCLQCAQKYLDTNEFPVELKAEIIKLLKSKSDD